VSHSPNHPPTSPRNGNGHKGTQRSMLSMAMLSVSIGSLGIAFLGGARLILDIFNEGLKNSFDQLGPKVIVIGLAYGVGWLTAMVAIRVYGNLVLPSLINWMTWGCLAGVCVLYLVVLMRLYQQAYDIKHYWAYILIVFSGLASMVGLHLIIEDHDLRPFSVPLLIISLIQIGAIVHRYVFTPDAKPDFLWKDLFLFFSMAAFAMLMLAHWGLLEPLRHQLTNYFDRNSTSIRTDN